MLSGLFITGTNTNVGKTVAAAALLQRFRGEAQLRYWKPIQTGIEQDDDTAEVQRLAACGAHDVLSRGIRLPLPVSPHLAARWSGQVIDLCALASIILSESGQGPWIVEGAGGVLVPVNEFELMADLIILLKLPALIVAPTALGTINHTLLTLEGLRFRSIVVAGVLLVGDSNADNRKAIEHYGRVRVVGEMPHFPQLSPEELARWSSSELDPQGYLLEFLK